MEGRGLCKGSSLASDEHPLASTAQVGVQAGLPEAGAEGNKFSYNPLTDWSHKDTLRLCEHVGRDGGQQWDVLAEVLRCPAVLCALKWHVLVLDHERSQSRLKVPKWYSDWELCVLMKACASGLAQQMSKASIYQVMAGWLPGRTAAGLKQAYAANFAPADGSAEPQMAATFQKNNWPTELTPLMMAWPGPHQLLKARTTDEDKALAAELLITLHEKGPAASNTSSGRKHSAAAAAAAASATPPASPGVTSPHANAFARNSVQLSGAQQQLPHHARGHKGMLRLTPAAVGAAALAAPALLPPADAAMSAPAMQQLQSMGSGGHAGGGPSWLQAPAQPAGGLMHAVGRLQQPQHALLAQYEAHSQQQQQQQGVDQQQQLQACLDYLNLDQLQAAAQFAVIEATSTAGESVSNGTAARGEFDLPEEDSLLRQALEQHLDAALCATIAADLQITHTIPMQNHQQQQQQQQTGAPMDADATVDVAAAVAAAAAAAAQLVNGVPLGQGPKRQRTHGNHVPAAAAAATSQPPNMLPPELPLPPEWGNGASVGRANSFPGGLAQGPGGTAQHSVQLFRRSASGLRFMTAADRGAAVNGGDRVWAQQQQQQQQQQQNGWVPHGLQTEGQQQPWSQQHNQQQQQYYSPLQVADQQSLLACAPTWDQVNLLLQRVQALEQQQHVMQEEIVRLRIRVGDI